MPLSVLLFYSKIVIVIIIEITAYKAVHFQCLREVPRLCLGGSVRVDE